MLTSKTKSIAGYPGIILDILRLTAALTVFADHLLLNWFQPLTVQYKIRDFAHTAVIVFFVISGYLIAFTTTKNNRGGVRYMQARFSRLYSIVLPALAITGLCQLLVSHLGTDLHVLIYRGLSWPRYLMAGLFLNEIWFLSAGPPMNTPLWSLGYEFWYYMIFGLWFFRRRGLRSLILPATACFIAGPKILLLFPVWLIGYLAYSIPMPEVPKRTSFFLAGLCFILGLAVPLYIPDLPLHDGSKPLYFSAQFFTDLMTGLFIGLALWLIPQGESKPTVFLNKYLRLPADLTFAVYALHYPLMILWKAFFQRQLRHASEIWEPALVILLISVATGYLLEKSRYRWNEVFSVLFSRIKTRLYKTNQ